MDQFKIVVIVVVRNADIVGAVCLNAVFPDIAFHTDPVVQGHPGSGVRHFLHSCNAQEHQSTACQSCKRFSFRLGNQAKAIACDQVINRNVQRSGVPLNACQSHSLVNGHGEQVHAHHAGHIDHMHDRHGAQKPEILFFHGAAKQKCQKTQHCQPYQDPENTLSAEHKPDRLLCDPDHVFRCLFRKGLGIVSGRHGMLFLQFLGKHPGTMAAPQEISHCRGCSCCQLLPQLPHIPPGIENQQSHCQIGKQHAGIFDLRQPDQKRNQDPNGMPPRGRPCLVSGKCDQHIQHRCHAHQREQCIHKQLIDSDAVAEDHGHDAGQHRARHCAAAFGTGKQSQKRGQHHIALSQHLHGL